MIPVIIVSVIILLVASFSVWQTNQYNNVILKEIKRFAQQEQLRLEQVKRPKNGDTGVFHDTAQEINSNIISNSIGSNARRWVYRVVFYKDTNNQLITYWFRGRFDNGQLIDVQWKKADG